MTFGEPVIPNGTKRPQEAKTKRLQREHRSLVCCVTLPVDGGKQKVAICTCSPRTEHYIYDPLEGTVASEKQLRCRRQGHSG
jgi:hypothetical protein